jgi:hypothetical protein
MAEPRTEDAVSKVSQYLERFAQERDLALPPMGPDGVVRIQRGSAVVSVHVLAAQGIILFLARVADPPAEDDAERLRMLLTASFTATGDAAFALSAMPVVVPRARGVSFTSEPRRMRPYVSTRHPPALTSTRWPRA